MKTKTLIALFVLASATVLAQQPVTISGLSTQKKPIEVKLFKVVAGEINVIATSQPATQSGKFGFQFYPEYEGFYMVGTGTHMAPQDNYKFWFKGGDKLSLNISDSNYTLTGATNSKENIVLNNWHQLTREVEIKSVYFMLKNINSTYVDFFPVFEKTVAKAKAWQAAQKSTGNKTFDAMLPKIVTQDLNFLAVNFISTPREAHPEEDELIPYYSTLEPATLFKTTTDVYFHPFGQRTFSSIVLRDVMNKNKKFEAGLNGLKNALSHIPNDTLKGDYALDYASNLSDYNQYITHKEVFSNYILTDHQKAKDFAMESALATLKPGDKGIAFTLEDVNGKKVSFADLKGKVVLIDVWATWCQPCRIEFPHLKELEEAMKTKDVAIVSISVDEEEDKEKWKKTVINQQLGGIQLFAKGWSDITRYYKIDGIPRFMVFDKEGKIVDVYAPRPSDPELKILLEKVLSGS